MDPYASAAALVYVTLGTIVFEAVHSLRAVIDGLARLDVDVLVTVGPNGDVAKLGRLPRNVRAERFVPQDVLMAHVDVAVHHCGSGTMLGSLAHGVPQLAIPHGADQYMNAEALQRSGAGSRLMPDEITPDAVAAHVRGLLGDPTYADRGAPHRDRRSWRCRNPERPCRCCSTTPRWHEVTGARRSEVEDGERDRHHRRRQLERRPRRTLAEGAEEFSPCSSPVREVVVSIPAPRCDHRKHEDPALAEQFLIGVRIVLAHLFGHMGDVELDRPTATRLEVDEQQPVLRAEQVAWVRLAVQQLLGGAAVADRSSQASQRVAEKLPVRVSERRSVVAAPDQPLSLRDSIREVRRREIDLPHAGMQPLERVRVVGWRDLSRRHRFVVGPQGDHEAVTHVDARLDSRLKRSHRALGFREPLSKLDLELCARLIRHGRDPGDDVTRQQAQDEPVRVLKNDRVVDRQVKR